MNSRKPITDELTSLDNALPADPHQNPYSVPEGYFEGLADAIMSRLKTGSAADEIRQLSPLLAGISRHMPYSVPEGFFEESIGSLPALTADEDPVLFGNGPKTLPFDVPTGYFQQLPAQILDRLPKQEAPVVQMNAVTRKGSKWMKMAVAAAVAGVLAISGLRYFNSADPAITAPEGQSIARELKAFSDSELESFVRNTDAGSNLATRKKPARKGEAALLKDVSDKELEAFLDQFPSDDDDSGIN